MFDGTDLTLEQTREAFRTIKNKKCFKNNKGFKRETLEAFYIVVVPRDRIELPTRGFSVPCSTD
jgi:hypothetical protein